MTIELLRAGEGPVLSNSGVSSRQLVSPQTSRSKRVTVTRVTVAAGARNPPHRHASEQIWVALHGNGKILLEDGRTEPFAAGDVVRFEDEDLHGFENTGESEFEYLSVTAPPVDFRGAYAKDWSKA